jgi:D-beta-D-heptose 7-phosphate kinase/D-beta-D-heptose 1-phosphate adenosyltransferase
VILPNTAEICAAMRMSCKDDDEAGAVASAARKCGIDNVLLTRSARGMTLASKRGKVTHLPARAREIHDVSGAGDTVVAAVAVGLAAGLKLEDAAQVANIAGGVVVGKVGTAAVYHEDLADAVQRADMMSLRAEIATREQAVDHVARWRSQGLKVGFTNGCFDLIHPGHISLLTQAKKACDRLIVGLNTDDSTRRLKGSSRPVQNETARSVVLASLAAVDLVVSFDEDTPIRLIEAIRPDVLVKGADYAEHEVVGAELVTSYGGEVVLAKLKKGFSTTLTIAGVVEPEAAKPGASKAAKPSKAGAASKGASRSRKRPKRPDQGARTTV